MTDELTEPFVVADVYCNGLAEVEYVGGGNFRFVFFCLMHGERVAVAKLVAPAEAVPPAVLMAAKAVGFSMARALAN